MTFPRYRTTPQDLRAPRNWRQFFILGGITVVIAAILTFLFRQFEPWRMASRDIGTIALVEPENLVFYTGWIVYLGAIVWFFGAGVAFFAAAAVRRSGARTREAGMLAGFGGILLLLGADDLFQFHDNALLLLHIGESKTMIAWGIIAVLWGLWYLPEILRTPELPMFVLGVLFFAHSTIADLDHSLPLRVAEEATKFTGVLCFAIWVWLIAFRLLTPKAVATPEPTSLAAKLAAPGR